MSTQNKPQRPRVEKSGAFWDVMVGTQRVSRHLRRDAARNAAASAAVVLARCGGLEVA